jgi:hypothetical protein
MRTILPLRSLSLVLVVLAVSSVFLEQKSFAEIGIAVSIGPPALPVYEQPVCPGDGYLWTPGYWAYDYDDADYYWVPGTWVLAPEVGFLWTPGWWGWGDGGFFFHEGFWGRTSVSMAESITASATSAWASKAGAGMAGTSFITAPS